MVTELDFEELDDMMEQMDEAQDLTASIAADVAKVSPKQAAKKPAKKSPKKPAEQKPAGKVVKVTKAKVATNPQKPKLDVKAQTKPMPAKAEEGERVMVRVLTQYAEEPEEPVYQPNPKVGKFMDFVSPLSDMSVEGERPNLPTPIIVVEASETTVEVVEEVSDDEDDEENRERLEKNGLDPDATVEEMMDAAEPEDDDEFLEELMSSLGDDIEEEPEPNEQEGADILDMPDRSEAFLPEVDIEKRPLGGNAVAAAMEIDPKEAAADKAFAEDKPDERWLEQDKQKPGLSKKEQKKAAKLAAKQAKKQPKPQVPHKKKSRVGQAFLYVFLIILLLILGGSLGALAYFSGLI